MSQDSPNEDLSLQNTTFGQQIINRVSMADPRHVLFIWRPSSSSFRRVVSGGPHELDSTRSPMVGLGSNKSWEEAMMDVNDSMFVAPGRIHQ